MKLISKYGYLIVFNNTGIEEDIEVYNEAGKLVCAFTKEDIFKLARVLASRRTAN